MFIFSQPPPPCCEKHCSQAARACSMFVLVVLLGFVLVLTSLIISGNIIMMMTTVDDAGNVVYPNPGTIILVVATVIFTNLLVLVSVSSMACAIVKKMRARRIARQAAALAGQGNNSPPASPSPRPLWQAPREFFSRAYSLMPAWRLPSPQQSNLYVPLNTEEQQEMIPMSPVQYGNVTAIQQPRPQYVAPQQIISSHSAPQVYLRNASTASPVYVPVTVSAESMTHINML